jgi:hypothetical protein
MIILKEQEAPQNLYATIDGLLADAIVLRDEETNTEETIECVFSIDKYYAVTNLVFPIIQNKFYTLTILNGTDVVYKDKIFCTNQIIEQFSINKDVYTQKTSDNEYIIYE